MLLPQLAYQTWVSSVKTALRERQSLQRHLRTKKQEKDGPTGKGKKGFCSLDLAVTVIHTMVYFMFCVEGNFSGMAAVSALPLTLIVTLGYAALATAAVALCLDY